MVCVPRIPSAYPCESPPLSPQEWRAQGFPASYDHHQWCAKHYVGELGEDGEIERCPCDCHSGRIFAACKAGDHASCTRTYRDAEGRTRRCACTCGHRKSRQADLFA